jgi:uncharacterized protein (UPF0548 family)
MCFFFRRPALIKDNRTQTHTSHTQNMLFLTFGSKPSVKAQRETIERGRLLKNNHSSSCASSSSSSKKQTQKKHQRREDEEDDGRKNDRKNDDGKSKNRFNIDVDDVGKTRDFQKFVAKNREGEKKKYAIDETKILVGTKGDIDYEKAKRALKSWRQFQLGWTEVDANTEVRKGNGVCVLIHPLPRVWVQNPLEISYVIEEEKKRKKTFSFAHTTLHGHLLAGEEKFTVEKEEDERVYFKVETFSKADHILAKVTYPAVRALQKIFGAHAGLEMKKAVRNEK